MRPRSSAVATSTIRSCSSATSTSRIGWRAIQQAIAALGVRVLGDDARPLVAQYLNARAYTIFGGSSEVQREILAREVLG
jgi:alkylation response protein AidB-like acyl-CoA dehydrogenase